MKKFLYVMPAVLICMLYGLLAALAGGIGGFQIVAYLYITCPILSGIFLRRDKWWGCLFGMAMGGILIHQSVTAEPTGMIGFVAGLILAAYYAAMGLVCAGSQKKQ